MKEGLEGSGSIRVDTQKLREIIPYIAFKCSPQSSVARGKAVIGSDIDGALVVTDQPTTEEDQLRLVDELRRQGFQAVFHISEAIKIAKRAKEKWGENRERFEEKDLEDRLLFILEVQSRTGVIIFATEEEAGNLDPDEGFFDYSLYDIYHRGFEIK